MNLDNLKTKEKYNLFVTADEQAYEATLFAMPTSRCLTSFTSQEIKDDYGSLDEEAIEEIKTYPCIFAYEDSCKKDPNIGYITEITKRSTEIRFRFNMIDNVTYSDLHDWASELDIDMPRGVTELMHTHWTIKNVNLYEELVKKGVITKPNVFISYCWTPKENKDKAMHLAKRLCDDGVNVKYDENSLQPGQDIIAFMESLANDSTIKKVLVVCNSDYARKADSRQGGVGIEAEIIISQVYGKPMQNKIVPIYFEKDSNGAPFCPSYLKTRWGIDLTNGDEGYAQLIEDIFR